MAKASNMTVECMLIALWPKLKAVVERSAGAFGAHDPTVNNVWILTESALRPVTKVDCDNPVVRIIQSLYGTRRSGNGLGPDSLDIASPVFATEHDIDGLFDETSQEIVSIRRYMTYPNPAIADATLTDPLLLGLQFHTVVTPAPALSPPVLGQAEWIWRLCCFSRAALQTSNFVMTATVVGWIGALLWLRMVSLDATI